MDRAPTLASLDLLIPCYNEQEALPALLDRLQSVFSTEGLRDAKLSGVRLVFVDDGSRDETAKLIADRIHAGLPAVLIRLSRNFGHQAALTAGFDLADADFVAVIDADLQDPPELIPRMIAKAREGYEVVYGRRRSRDAGPALRIAYWGFYRLLTLISDVSMPVDAGDFCVIRRAVLEALRELPERLRFHRGLRSWVGFRQAALEYDRPRRAAGRSKYGLRQLYELATHGVASMTIRPLSITQAILFFSLVATLVFVAVGARQYLRSGNPIALWFLATQALLAFTASLQIFCLYIMGAYIGRMYLEVKGRPSYIVMEKVSGRNG